MASAWSTGLCQCTIDVMQCLDTYFCPCCAGSRQWNAIEGRTNECDVMHCCMHAFCGPCSTVCIRTKVVEKYTIDEGAVVSCLLALCCGPCSMCQTHRELSQRNVWPGGTVCHKQPTSYDSLK